MGIGARRRIEGMRVSLLAVAAVLLSWQVATDAFPVSMDDEVAFIDDAAPKKTAAQKIAAAQVKESKAEVARARAIVEGRDPNASGGAGAVSATASASNGGVASPASVRSSLKTSKIVKQKNANIVNPRSLVTHKVPIGNEGWRQDQGARKINTADYELEKIKRHLGFQRQEMYAESRRRRRTWPHRSARKPSAGRQGQCSECKSCNPSLAQRRAMAGPTSRWSWPRPRLV